MIYTNENIEQFASALLNSNKEAKKHIDKARNEVLRTKIQLQKVDKEEAIVVMLCKSFSGATYTVQIGYKHDLLHQQHNQAYSLEEMNQMYKEQNWSCTCPFYPRAKLCKHLLGILLYFKDKSLSSMFATQIDYNPATPRDSTNQQMSATKSTSSGPQGFVDINFINANKDKLAAQVSNSIYRNQQEQQSNTKTNASAPSPAISSVSRKMPQSLSTTLRRDQPVEKKKRGNSKKEQQDFIEQDDSPQARSKTTKVSVNKGPSSVQQQSAFQTSRDQEQEIQNVPKEVQGDEKRRKVEIQEDELQKEVQGNEKRRKKNIQEDEISGKNSANKKRRREDYEGEDQGQSSSESLLQAHKQSISFWESDAVQQGFTYQQKMVDEQKEKERQEQLKREEEEKKIKQQTGGKVKQVQFAPKSITAAGPKNITIVGQQSPKNLNLDFSDFKQFQQKRAQNQTQIQNQNQGQQNVSPSQRIKEFKSNIFFQPYNSSPTTPKNIDSMHVSKNQFEGSPNDMQISRRQFDNSGVMDISQRQISDKMQVSQRSSFQDKMQVSNLGLSQINFKELLTLNTMRGNNLSMKDLVNSQEQRNQLDNIIKSADQAKISQEQQLQLQQQLLQQAYQQQQFAEQQQQQQAEIEKKQIGNMGWDRIAVPKGYEYDREDDGQVQTFDSQSQQQNNGVLQNIFNKVLNDL